MNYKLVLLAKRIEWKYLNTPFFRKLSFKDMLDFLSCPYGRKRNSKQQIGTPSLVFCS